MKRDENEKIAEQHIYIFFCCIAKVTDWNESTNLEIFSLYIYFFQSVCVYCFGNWSLLLWISSSCTLLYERNFMVRVHVISVLIYLLRCALFVLRCECECACVLCVCLRHFYDSKGIFLHFCTQLWFML